MTEADADLYVDVGSGWLAGARRCPSPNRDARPDPQAIELLVVHGISLPPGCFGGDAIDRLFTNTLDPDADPSFQALAELRVSAHLLVRRHGELVQYVPFHERAWHAGESCWSGRTACNDFTIGVELEGTDHEPYAPVQYARLAEVVRALASAYPRFDTTHLVGHADIAPDRKTDPGPAFEWARLRALLGCGDPAGR